MGETNSSWPPLNYNNNSGGSGAGGGDNDRAQMDQETMHHYVPDKLLWTLSDDKPSKISS